MSKLLFHLTFLCCALQNVHAQNTKLNSIVLTNVTLISLIKDSIEPNRVLVIKDGRIKDIFLGGSKPLPNGIEVLDLKNKYVIPGLIDAHYHILANRRRSEIDSLLEYALMGGITSVREMASDALLMKELGDKANGNKARLPKIFYSAVFAGAPFFGDDQRISLIMHGLPAGTAPWAKIISDTTNIQKAIILAKASGVTAIKIYAEMTPALVKKVTKSAHMHGLKVWSHATIFPARPSDAVAAKVDVLSHAIDLTWQLEDSLPHTVYPLPANYSKPRAWDRYSVNDLRIDALLITMKTNGTALDATVSHTHTRIVLRQLALPDSLRRIKDPALYDKWTFGITKKAYEYGIPILAGSDYQENPAKFEYPSIHYELELLTKECGMSNVDALRAASINVAKSMGKQKEIGTVEIGKIADLLILEKNPLNDILNTKSITDIMKNGEILKRKNPYSKAD
jgi:imidazolonepropionase-like amidohydrolase